MNDFQKALRGGAAGLLLASGFGIARGGLAAHPEAYTYLIVNGGIALVGFGFYIASTIGDWKDNQANRGGH